MLPQKLSQLSKLHVFKLSEFNNIADHSTFNIRG